VKLGRAVSFCRWHYKTGSPRVYSAIHGK